MRTSTIIVSTLGLLFLLVMVIFGYSFYRLNLQSSPADTIDISQLPEDYLSAYSQKTDHPPISRPTASFWGDSVTITGQLHDIKIDNNNILFTILVDILGNNTYINIDLGPVSHELSQLIYTYEQGGEASTAPGLTENYSITTAGKMAESFESYIGETIQIELLVSSENFSQDTCTDLCVGLWDEYLKYKDNNLKLTNTSADISLSTFGAVIEVNNLLP